MDGMPGTGDTDAVSKLSAEWRALILFNRVLRGNQGERVSGSGARRKKGQDSFRCVIASLYYGIRSVHTSETFRCKADSNYPSAWHLNRIFIYTSTRPKCGCVLEAARQRATNGNSGLTLNTYTNMSVADGQTHL